jgi:hypothetical protein
LWPSHTRLPWSPPSWSPASTVPFSAQPEQLSSRLFWQLGGKEGKPPSLGVTSVPKPGVGMSCVPLCSTPPPAPHLPGPAPAQSATLSPVHVRPSRAAAPRAPWWPCAQMARGPRNLGHLLPTLGTPPPHPRIQSARPPQWTFLTLGCPLLPPPASGLLPPQPPTVDPNAHFTWSAVEYYAARQKGKPKPGATSPAWGQRLNGNGEK